VFLSSLKSSVGGENDGLSKGRCCQGWSSAEFLGWITTYFEAAIWKAFRPGNSSQGRNGLPHELVDSLNIG